MAVTALTGCASLLLGPHATTLHSWAGIGLGREPVATLINSIVLNGRKKKFWKQTDCLVIDEVSMLSPQLLDVLDEIGRVVRKNRTVPMGGMQVVFVGDFYQLPPVNKDEKTASFAFQSAAWKNIVQANFELKTIHRQSDPVFQTILNEARIGKLSESSYKILSERKGVSWRGQLIKPTLLFTRNDNVNELNRRGLEKLVGEEVVFKVETARSGKEGERKLETFFGGKAPVIPEELVDRVNKFDKDAPYDTELSLKVGAQVMLVVNMHDDKRLVNGSRGVIERFTEKGLPVVKFLCIDQPVRIDRHEWKFDETISRTQVPLRLAYALTIHKAQGASLDSALVDIGRSTFEYGQAYVALSRVRNLEGLYVYEIDPIAFRVHPSVKAFYDSLPAPALSKIASPDAEA